MACQEYKIEEASAQKLFDASFDLYYGHVVDARRLFDYVHDCEGSVLSAEAKEDLEDDFIEWTVNAVQYFLPENERKISHTSDDFQQEFNEKYLPVARQYNMFDKFSVRMIPHDQAGKLQGLTVDELEEKGKYLLVVGVDLKWDINLAGLYQCVGHYNEGEKHLPAFVKESRPGYFTIQKDCNCCEP